MNFRNIFLILALLGFLSSCSNKEKAIPAKAGMGMRIDTLTGNCPYLTKDNKGNLVLSWARMITDTSAVFCYTILDKSTNQPGKIISIPASANMQPHSENLPKIVFKPSGEIIALWGAPNRAAKNKYAGLVYYSQSFDNGLNWSKARPLVTDTTGFDQRYYDVDLLPSGEAAIIWLDNRKSTRLEGSALYFASTNGKNGFQNERKIGEGCCQCCRTDLFIDSRCGVHVLYRGIIKDSIRDMLHSVSMDGGSTFSEAKLISEDNWVIQGCPHTGPAMTENRAGLHFAWYTGGQKKGCFYTQSNDNGQSFSQNDHISDRGSHPQLASLSSGELLVAWDEPLQMKGKFARGIAIERRSADGARMEQRIITPDTIEASYPVIIDGIDETAVVAYTVKENRNSYIMYQLVQ